MVCSGFGVLCFFVFSCSVFLFASFVVAPALVGRALRRDLMYRASQLADFRCIFDLPMVPTGVTIEQLVERVYTEEKKTYPIIYIMCWPKELTQ